MREQYSQFFFSCFYLRQFRPWIEDIVKAVDEETAFVDDGHFSVLT